MLRRLDGAEGRGQRLGVAVLRAVEADPGVALFSGPVVGGEAGARAGVRVKGRDDARGGGVQAQREGESVAYACEEVVRVEEGGGAVEGVAGGEGERGEVEGEEVEGIEVRGGGLVVGYLAGISGSGGRRRTGSRGGEGGRARRSRR